MNWHKLGLIAMLNLQNVTVKWDMYRQVLKLYKVQMHLQSLSKNNLF